MATAKQRRADAKKRGLAGRDSPDWGKNPQIADQKIRAGTQDAAQVPGKCNAKTRKGHPCGLPAGFGTDHMGTGRCKQHGGNVPTQRKAAAEQEAIRQQILFGAPVGIEPHIALVQELARTNGAIMMYQEALQQRTDTLRNDQDSNLAPDELFDPTDLKSAAFLKYFNEERDRLAKMAKASLDLGLKERQVQMLEALAAGILLVVTGTLKSLGFSPEQIEEARPIVREQLQLVAAGKTE